MLSLPEIAIIVTLLAGAYTLGQLMSKKQDKSSCSSKHDALHTEINALREAVNNQNILLSKLETEIKFLREQVNITKQIEALEKKIVNTQ